MQRDQSGWSYGFWKDFSWPQINRPWATVVKFSPGLSQESFFDESETDADVDEGQSRAERRRKVSQQQQQQRQEQEVEESEPDASDKVSVAAANFQLILF